MELNFYWEINISGLEFSAKVKVRDGNGRRIRKEILSHPNRLRDLVLCKNIFK